MLQAYLTYERFKLLQSGNLDSNLEYINTLGNQNIWTHIFGSVTWDLCMPTQLGYRRNISDRRLTSDSMFFQEVRVTLRWWPQNLNFLPDQFLSSGRLDVEVAVLFYRQCLCFCQFYYNILAYRTKIPKPFVSFNLHILYKLHYIHYNTYVVCFYRFRKLKLPVILPCFDW